MEAKEAIIEFAESMVGKQEIAGNMGFHDPFFDMLMRRVGFENGWAWCSLFAEACWSHPTYTGKSKVIASISDNFSANAVRTFENFKKDRTGLFVVDREPDKGAVVIWEKRRGGDPVKTGIWTLGHAGIVKGFTPSIIHTIEGNTNSSGGREGIEVAQKRRTYNFDDRNGLCLLGFIKMNLT